MCKLPYAMFPLVYGVTLAGWVTLLIWSVPALRRGRPEARWFLYFCFVTLPLLLSAYFRNALTITERRYSTLHLLEPVPILLAMYCLMRWLQCVSGTSRGVTVGLVSLLIGAQVAFLVAITVFALGEPEKLSWLGGIVLPASALPAAVGAAVHSLKVLRARRQAAGNSHQFLG